MGFLKKNWFVIGVFASLFLGVFTSEFGIMLNRGAFLSNSLVVLIFIITGLKLPVDAVKSGLKYIKVHIYIQLFIFAFIPLYFYFSSKIFQGVFGPQIIAGIYALACLPCTISSCIIFTQSSGGNAVVTMFNAALANIIGVILSPLLLSLMIKNSTGMLPPDELIGIFQKLVLIMILPIAAGQFLRRWFSDAADKYKNGLGVISNLFILIILYLAFSRSAGNPSFAGNLRTMVYPYIYLAVSFILLFAAAWGGAALLGFGVEERISSGFAAPTKTLAMGVPLLSTYFALQPELLGIALLPLIFYHPWQLFVSGVLQEIVKKMSAR